MFGHLDRKWRRKGDVDGVNSARADAESEVKACWGGGLLDAFQRLWLHLNKPEFKTSPGSLKLKLTRTIIARDFSMVLASLRIGSRHTDKLLHLSLKPTVPESGFLENGLVMGQSWFAKKDGVSPPANDLIAYLSSADNPHHPSGSNELFVCEDQDATQFCCQCFGHRV